MVSSGKPLLIISRNALLAAEKSALGDKAFRILSNCTRKGCHLLLTAPEPDNWFPTRGNQDDVLSVQGRIGQKFHETGGDLDGVYYVPRSLFTQDRNRTGALKDIMTRYSTGPENTIILSSSTPFLKAAHRLGITTHEIRRDDTGVEQVLQILTGISESI